MRPFLIASIFCLFGFLFVFGLATRSHAESFLPLPYQEVRQLQSVQEHMAEGIPNSRELQKKILAEMAVHFPAHPLYVWQDRRNAYALFSYILNGGDPRLLRVLFAPSTRGALPEAVLTLALAYALGDRDKARESLKSLAVLTIHRYMGGQIALMAADLFKASAPQEAERYLGIARLLMPGTLIEETALRRLLDISLKAQNFEKFFYFSEKYVRRFPNSVYFPKFLALLSSAILEAKYAEKKEEEILFIIRKIPLQKRCIFLLDTVRESLFQGSLKTTQTLLKDTPPCQKQATFKQRAILYEAILENANFYTPETLEKINKLLPLQWEERDGTLLRWMISLAKTVQAWPQSIPNSAPAPALSFSPQQNQMITHAQELLKAPLKESP